MRIGLTQMDVAWEDKKDNMDKVKRLTSQAKGKADILVFPEMTLTGFTMNTGLAGEEMLFSQTLHFFKEMSKEYEMALMFGFVEDFGKEYYNKLMMVHDGRVVYEYDKIHPFNYSEEGEHYIGGHEIRTAEYEGMRFSGFVCYDLRFPEIFQAAADKADVIFVIANWPKERVLHWETLLRARAIENQCFVVGVNRVGRGNGLEYVESSMAFDPMGERLTKAHSRSELMIIDIDPKETKRVREKLPFRKDRQWDMYIDFYGNR